MKTVLELSVEIVLKCLALFFLVFIGALVVGSIVSTVIALSVFDQAVLFGIYAVVAQLIVFFGAIVYYVIAYKSK